MANYKIEVVESENNQLKTKLKKSSQFEQLYKDTYQEKKLFEQELKGKTQELESLKKQAKAGKANLEKERQLVSKIEELQSELTNKTTEIQELSQQLDQDIELKSLLINWLTSSKSLHNKLQLISLSRKKLPEFDYSQLFNYLKQLTEILKSLTYEQN
jgi:chromosome segregation ATPase